MFSVTFTPLILIEFISTSTQAFSTLNVALAGGEVLGVFEILGVTFTFGDAEMLILGVTLIEGVGEIEILGVTLILSVAEIDIEGVTDIDGVSDIEGVMLGVILGVTLGETCANCCTIPKYKLILKLLNAQRPPKCYFRDGKLKLQLILLQLEVYWRVFRKYM